MRFGPLAVRGLNPHRSFPWCAPRPVPSIAPLAKPLPASMRKHANKPGETHDRLIRCDGGAPAIWRSERTSHPGGGKNARDDAQHFEGRPRAARRRMCPRSRCPPGAEGRKKATAMSWTKATSRRSATLSRPPSARLVPAIAASKPLCSSHARGTHPGSTVQPNNFTPLISRAVSRRWFECVSIRPSQELAHQTPSPARRMGGIHHVRVHRLGRSGQAPARARRTPRSS